MVEACGARPVDSLWDRLSTIPDRRGRNGRRYGLASVLALALALAAMLAGANDLRAIFRWGRRLPPEALFLLGLERAPCHAMYPCFFMALDVEAVEKALGEWVRGSDALGHVAFVLRQAQDEGQASARLCAGLSRRRRGVHPVAAFASRLGG